MRRYWTGMIELKCLDFFILRIMFPTVRCFPFEMHIHYRTTSDRLVTVHLLLSWAKRADVGRWNDKLLYGLHSLAPFQIASDRARQQIRWQHMFSRTQKRQFPCAISVLVHRMGDVVISEWMLQGFKFAAHHFITPGYVIAGAKAYFSA